MVKVYLISSEINGKKHYKIGYTKRNIEQRVKEFKTGNSSNFEIVDYFNSEWGTKIEALLHNRFKNKLIRGEWFLLDDGDIENFKSICENYHNNFNLLLNNTYIVDRIEKGKKI